MLYKNANSNKSINSKGNVMLVIAVVVAFVILITGLYWVFLPGKKVPQKFFDIYGEIMTDRDTLAEYLFNEDPYIQSIYSASYLRDYNGAAAGVESSLVRISTILSKVNSHQQKIEELKKEAEKIRSQEIREKALALTSALDEEHGHVAKIFENEKEWLEELRTVFRELSVGNMPSASITAADDILARNKVEADAMREASDKLHTATGEFQKAVGLDKIQVPEEDLEEDLEMEITE